MRSNTSLQKVTDLEAFPRHKIFILWCKMLLWKSLLSNEDLVPTLKKEQQAAIHDHPRKLNFPQCHLHTSETIFLQPSSNLLTLVYWDVIPKPRPVWPLTQGDSTYSINYSTLLITTYPLRLQLPITQTTIQYYLPPSGLIPTEQIQVAPYKSIVLPLPEILYYSHQTGYRSPEKPKQYIQKTVSVPEHQPEYTASHTYLCT